MLIKDGSKLCLVILIGLVFNFSTSFQNASLSLLWDVTPYVGVLQSGQSNKRASSFILPSFASQQQQQK